jgi:tetratricopeptide (TPR) repeat protein
VQRGFKEDPAPAEVKRASSNFVVRSTSNMAAIEYDQVVTDQTGSENHTREQRVLVKKGDRWQIVSQVTVGTDSFGDTPQAVEASLNGSGYRLLSAGKVNEAIELFKLNVRLYPNSWNVYDSLAEAYAKAGNTALAIQNYEKSIELNPKNESGKAALAKLKEK